MIRATKTSKIPPTVAATPDEILREMGGRLDADFSNVRFHSDANSMSRSRAMGARAWAQGRDVYFGKGGFDPSVAAHELVHTVQQGAVHGNVSQAMPMGAVQLLPSVLQVLVYQGLNVVVVVAFVNELIIHSEAFHHAVDVFAALLQPVRMYDECLHSVLYLQFSCKGTNYL